MLEPFVNVLQEFIGGLTTDDLLVIIAVILGGIFLVLLFRK